MSDKAPIQMNRQELLEYIQDNLYPEVERLTSELADRDAWYAAVMDETCDQEEKHCPCVPALRDEIKRLRTRCAWLIDNAEDIAAGRITEVEFE